MDYNHNDCQECKQHNDYVVEVVSKIDNKKYWLCWVCWSTTTTYKLNKYSKL